MDLQEGLAAFQLQLRADGRSVHTRDQYARHIRCFGRWLADEQRSTGLVGIDHETIALFLVSRHATHRPDGKPKLATSMNALRSSLKAFFGYLHHAGFTDRDPGRLIRQARCGRPVPRVLSEDEQKRLLDALAAATGPRAERDHALFSLLLATGIRLGSALALRWDNVDLNEGVLDLRHAKGDRRQTVELPTEIREHLRRFHMTRPSGFLFSGDGVTPLCARQVRHRLRRTLAAAGIERGATVHSLRHSFAARKFTESGDLFRVQRALGHHSIVSTLVYAGAGSLPSPK